MYDILIIGSGVAGYTAAIRAAQEGFKVAIVEKSLLGGTCLNRGCIPTKSLLYQAAKFDEAKNLNFIDFNKDYFQLNFKNLFGNINQQVSQMRQGIQYLLKSRGVTVIEGHAEFIDSHQVQVLSSSCILEAKFIIIATGAIPKIPKIKGTQSHSVIYSDHIFHKDFVPPNSITIVGAGYIGLEFAFFFQKVGTKVYLIESKNRILDNFDEEISTYMLSELRKIEITVELNASIDEIKEPGKLIYQNQNKERKEIQSEKILICTGRQPNFNQLGLETMGMAVTEAGISVDDHYRTSINHIFAIGDVIQGSQLAYVASAQAMTVIAAIQNKPLHRLLNTLPYCIFTKPEIACVGENEDSAKRKGFHFNVGKFLLSANGKAIIQDDTKGFIKILVEDDTNYIIGASMVCNQASELINQITLAINNRITINNFMKSLAIHPSYSEGIWEAIESIHDRCIHMISISK